MEHGHALIHKAVAQAVGWLPGDIAVEQQATPYRPGSLPASRRWHLVKAGTDVPS